MDANTKEKTLENLTKSEHILVVVAPDEGFDGLAAGLALYLSLVKLGKNVTILGENPTVSEAQRIYGVDKIGKIDGSKNPVIVIKDAVATVDKVSYFLDGDKLKVIIYPLPGSKGITPDSMSFEYTTSQPNLIFAVGFGNRESLEKEIPHEHKITPDTWIISINRQQMQQKFAQYEITSPGSTSISEATAIVLQDLALPLDEDIAYNLYTGISDSTDHFTPAKTTAQTFEIAAWLVKFGAGRASFAQSQQTRFDSTQPQPAFRQQLAPQQTTPPPTDQGQFPRPPKPPSTFNPPDFFDQVAPIEEVESLPEVRKDSGSKDWLKPPKIYKGSKSFDGENKG